MQTTLLEEENQNYINRENDRLCFFTNEIQFFVSNHNIANCIISFFVYVFFICYQFLSSLPPAPIDNPIMLPIDYYYAILTGTNSSPTLSMILMTTIFFDIVFIIIFFITFFIAFYSLVTFHHLPFAIKTFSFFLFYLIPLITPVLLVAFSRAYIYLSIIDNHLLFFITLISNVLLYSVICIVGICNSASSYRVTHVFSVQQPFQVIILVLLIAIVNQLIEFTSYSSISLLIVTAIIQFVGVVYLSICPLYNEQWLTVISLTNYIFSFAISIARIISEILEVWIPILILGISLIFAFLLSFLNKRILYTKIGFLKNVFERKKIERNEINNNISTLDLNSLETHRLWQLVKLDSRISTDILDIIYKKLNSRSFMDIFDIFFLFTLEQRIKLKQEIDITDHLSNINSLKVDFWKAVWRSDFSALPSLSAKVGHDRIVLKQSLLFKCKFNSEMKEKINKNFNPTVTKHSISSFSIFHLVCLLLFLISIGVQIFNISIYRKSYSKFVRFTNIRDFLSYLTIVQIDLWPIDQVSIGKSFSDARNQWKIIQSDEIFETNFIGDKSYNTFISEYLDSIEKYNKTKQLTSEVADVRIFEIFSSLFHKKNKFFEQTFSEETSNIRIISYIIILIIIFLYFSIFVISIIVSSSSEHRFFYFFQSFSKEDIKKYCFNQFQYQIDDETNKIVPVPLSKIEWKALKYLVASFLISFLTAVLQWLINIVDYKLLRSDSSNLSNYMDKSGYIVLAFSYYSASIFYENISTFVPTSQIIQAARESDAQFNNLFNIDAYRSMTRLIPESILKNLASYLYLSTINEPSNTIKNTILQLSSEIDLNDPPLYQSDFEFYLRIVIMMLFSILLTIFSYVSHYFLKVLHNASIDEKYGLLYEFEQFCNVDKSWKLQKYKSEELPLMLLIASSDMKINFASNIAREELNINVGNKITDINLGMIHSSEILTAIHNMKNSNASDPVKIKKDNGKFTIISPSFQIVSCIKTLKSIVLIDNVDEPEDKNDNEIYESANPFFKIGSPSSFSFKNDQIALISLKLIGLSDFIDEHGQNPQIIKTYLTAILSKIDEFEDFARISVRNNTLLLASRNITFSSVNQFVSICADFGMKAQEIVSSISKQYEAPVYCSVLFHRCEAVTLRMSEASCGQSDFTSNIVSFIDECHGHFLMNAIGFVPRMKTTQILNMSKIMTFPLKNGANADIFIFI